MTASAVAVVLHNEEVDEVDIDIKQPKQPRSLRLVLMSLCFCFTGVTFSAVLCFRGDLDALLNTFVWLSGWTAGLLMGIPTGWACFRDSLGKSTHKGAGTEKPPEAKELLHWVEGAERRGCGELIQRVNHIAIIVSDVGRSLTFYTEVIGFQQIRRPNFDRHGAWLTMGNLELHLIKGVPVVHDGEDLIVNHIALETDNPQQVLNNLIKMNVPFRQNVSVPDPLKARDNAVEDFSSADGKVMQFFIRDPDGYYLELCNCDILTKFCLMKEDDLRVKMLSNYAEGTVKAAPLRLPMIFKIGVLMHRAKKRVRTNLSKGFQTLLAEEMQRFDVKPAREVDTKLLQTLMNRRKTYCDITQGYSQKQLVSILKMVGNNARLAILVLKADRGDVRMFIPPSYLVCDDDEHAEPVKDSLQPRRFFVPWVRCDSTASNSLLKSKGFFDRDPCVADAAKYEKSISLGSWEAHIAELIPSKMAEFEAGYSTESTIDTMNHSANNEMSGPLTVADEQKGVDELIQEVVPDAPNATPPTAVSCWRGTLRQQAERNDVFDLP